MTVLTVWYYFPVPLATFAFLSREFWDSMCFWAPSFWACFFWLNFDLSLGFILWLEVGWVVSLCAWVWYYFLPPWSRWTSFPKMWLAVFENGAVLLSLVAGALLSFLLGSAELFIHWFGWRWFNLAACCGPWWQAPDFLFLVEQIFFYCCWIVDLGSFPQIEIYIGFSSDNSHNFVNLGQPGYTESVNQKAYMQTADLLKV